MRTAEYPGHAELAEIGGEFHRRGWVPGTSGSFSTLTSVAPLRLCITASGLAKDKLDETSFLELDDQGDIIQGFGKPPVETSLHTALYRALADVGSVLHTNSVWGTIVADVFVDRGAIEFEGYEMLKGLSGVTTHQHTEQVPIIANTQDYDALTHHIERLLRVNSRMHGFYIYRRGLYTWGETIADARRYVEIFEFLFEVVGRSAK